MARMRVRRPGVFHFAATEARLMKIDGRIHNIVLHTDTLAWGEVIEN